MQYQVSELLADKFPAEKAAELEARQRHVDARLSITIERARELGLPVRTDMPENILRLMNLYPQPTPQLPSNTCRILIASRAAMIGPELLRGGAMGVSFTICNRQRVENSS
jgi:hypothetical protein